jgi:DNA-directed RNA polymerase subunit RPC12/RpoP
MSDTIYKCKTCGTEMYEVDSHEDGNGSDWITLWCPECGAFCGPFMEKWGPEEHHWRFPKMTAFPEVKAHLVLSRDGPKE